MPSPKSGTAPSAVSPADPKNACEADDAKPGEMTEVKARQKESDAGDGGGGDPHKPPKSQEEREKKKSWIEIAMVNEKGKPVTGMPYKITLPDGATFAEGTLDEKGLARVDGIEPGSCKITFPTLDREAWEKA